MRHKLTWDLSVRETCLSRMNREESDLAIVLVLLTFAIKQKSKYTAFLLIRIAKGNKINTVAMSMSNYLQPLGMLNNQ